MPNQQILNFMNQGAPPLISEQVDARNMAQAQGYANLNSTMANTEMQRMKNDTMRDRSQVLKNFEGNTRSPEFAEKMGAIDPEMLANMQNQAAKMDKAEREQMLEQFSEISRLAGMSDTEPKWQQNGFAVPFQQREAIMSKSMTMQQVLDMKGEGKKGKGGGAGDKRGGLKAADENAIHSYTKDLFKGIYSPTTGQFMGFKKDTSRQEAAKIGATASRIVADNPNITLHEAVTQAAAQNGVEIVPMGKKGATAPAAGKGPSGNDFSHLWKGGQ